MRLQKIFVTGASGFIGRNLIQHLARLGDYSVTALTRSAVPEDASGAGRVRWIEGDLLEPQTYQAGLSGCETVVHLAAATGRATAKDFQRVNVEGTRLLLQACGAAGVRRLLFVSTIASGYPDQSHSPYAKTKSEAETIVGKSRFDFAILRPTLVLGEASPIWNVLKRIAALPVVPLLEGVRPARVQPVHVDDVARGIELLLKSGRFEGEVLEIGGPRPLLLREFLSLTQTALRGAPGRVVRLPLEPIRAVIAAAEPALKPLMPVTAGQLAVFANDCIAAENWLLEELRPAMQSTEKTIAALIQSERSSASGTQDRTSKDDVPPPGNGQYALRAECRAFSAYLTGAPPTPYVEEQYIRAVHAHGLGDDEKFSPFDRVTLRLARSGRVSARWSDAYCALFHRAGALRHKLIVLAAILEHVAPSSETFDMVEPRSIASSVLSLTVYGLISAVALLLGSVILVPAALVCWEATRLESSSVGHPRQRQ